MPGPFPKAGWVDASRQGSFLSKLGLSSQDAPTCVLLRQLQPTFQMARMAGSFSSDSIAAFLTRPDFQLLHQQVKSRLARLQRCCCFVLMQHGADVDWSARSLWSAQVLLWVM